MRPSKFSFLFYTTAVALGICSATFCSWKVVLSLFVFSTLLLVGLTSHKKLGLYAPKIFFITAAVFYVLCFSLGCFAVKLNNWRDNQQHYRSKVVDDWPYQVEFYLLSKQKKGSNATQYKVSIDAIDQAFTKGQALALLPDSTLPLGSRFRAIGVFKSFQKPQYPGQFDYAAFMKHKGIEKQLYLKEWQPIDKVASPYISLMQLRFYLQQNIQLNTAMSDQAKALINALLLGDRTDIERTKVDAFQQLGILHILAISGLHIGVIYLVLNRLTFWLNSTYRCLVILLFLWGFAFLSGGSPSVLRSVFIFSLLSISGGLKRKQSTLDMIGLSLFLSLLFQPNWLFDVGFQLSYMAVLGIVWLMPLFKRGYTQNKGINYLLSSLYVSLIAQCSVLPLQLYYFHSISPSFLVSNLLLLPFVTLLLILGLCFLCVGGIHPLVGQGFSLAIEYLTVVFFRFVEILNQHSVYLSDLFIERETMFLLFAGLFATGCLLHHFSFKRLKLILVGLVLVRFLSVALGFGNEKKQVFIIASAQGKEQLFLYDQDRVLWAFEKQSSPSEQATISQRYFKAKSLWRKPLQDVYQIDAQHSLLVLSKSMPFYQVSQTVKWLYFSENIKVNFDRVLEWHKPEAVIIGRDMTEGYKKRLKQSCVKRNIPFHDIRQKGYWSSQFL